jgi:hypothetical protein
MLEITIDLNWADDRYAFVREVQDYRVPNAQNLELKLTDDLKLVGSATNLRELAAQINAACDEHYPFTIGGIR